MAKNCAGVDTSILECSGGGDAGIWATIATIINILSILVGIVAVIGIAIFGIQILTAKGDPSRINKAKSRLTQIVLGLAAYILLWSGTQWLLPGGLFSSPNDIESLTINLISGKVYVGDTVSPRITFFPENPIDSSYTLTTEDNNIITINSNTILCLRAGEATITATSVNNQKDIATISCVNKPLPSKEDNDDEDEIVPGEALSKDEVFSEIDSMSVPTDDELAKAARALGISDINLEKILKLSNYEGYGDYADDADHRYLKYLQVCTFINHAIKAEETGKELYSFWGGGDTTYGENTVGRRTPTDSDKKYVYLALINPDERPWDSHGIISRNGFPRGSVASVQREQDAIHCAQVNISGDRFACAWDENARWYYSEYGAPVY